MARPIFMVPTTVDEYRCREETSLDSVSLRVVVGLIAAGRTGRIGCTASELMELTGMQRANMSRLVRDLWITEVGRIKGSVERVYMATSRAQVRLGLNGWLVHIFTAEELPRVDPNVPGFLVPAESCPGVVDTTGESVEQRAAG